MFGVWCLICLVRSSFYNGTISLIERPSDVDGRKLFTYFLLLSACGIIAYISVNLNNKNSKKSRKSNNNNNNSGENGTRNGNENENNNQWEVNAYKQSKQSKPRKYN